MVVEKIAGRLHHDNHACSEILDSDGGFGHQLLYRLIGSSG
jgi:hypothetical protein